MANRFFKGLHAVEDSVAVLAIFALAALLIAEAVARKVFNTGIRASGVYVEHLVLAATFLAGAVTSREKKHLALATGMFTRQPVSRQSTATAASFNSSAAGRATVR